MACSRAKYTLFLVFPIVRAVRLTLSMPQKKHLTNNNKYLLKTNVFDMIYTFSAGLSSRMSRDSAHDVQVNYLLLIKGQYVLSESREPLGQRKSSHFLNELNLQVCCNCFSLHFVRYKTKACRKGFKLKLWVIMRSTTILVSLYDESRLI